MNSVFELFLDTVKKHPQNNFYTYKYYGSWIRVDYQHGLSKVIAAIHALQSYHIKKGTHVAILSENRPEWILTYLALNALGATVVPLDSLLPAADLAKVIQHADVKLVIASEANYLFIQNDLTKLNVSLLKMDTLFERKHLNKDDLPKNSTYLAGDDISSIIYTSGTTGQPKGVMLSVDNFYAFITSIADITHISTDDAFLQLLPLHHIYAFACNVACAINYGVELVFPESLKSDDILEAVKEGKITIIPLVPQVLELFYRGIMAQVNNKARLIQIFFNTCLKIALFCNRYHLPNFTKFAFKKIRAKFGYKFRLFVSGGSKLNPHIGRCFQAFGLPFVEGYGLTETTSAIIATDSKHKYPPGTIGYPMTGMKARIDLPNAEGIGEIVVHGPMVMQGYYKEPAMTNEVLQADWFFTGDLGYKDRKGRYYICGRSKDVIVLPSGKNVYPDELMNYYTVNLEFIEDMCVFGLGDPGQEKVAALIYPKQNLLKYSFVELNELFKKEFIELSRHLPFYKTIAEWKFTFQPLPKTTTRKFRVAEIRQLYLSINDSSKFQNQTASMFQLQFNQSDTGKKLKKMLMKMLLDIEESSITYAANLVVDLGLDSLNRIDLICGLEKEFNLIISDEDAFGFETVGDIFNLIEKNKSAQPLPENATQQDIVERKYFLALRDILLKPKSSALQDTLLTAYRLFSNLKYKGLEYIPYKSPYIIYTNINNPLAYFWILLAFNPEMRRAIFAIENDNNPRHYAPLARKFGNIIKLRNVANYLSIGQMGEYVLKNKQVLFLQSNELNINKTPLGLKEVVNLAIKLKCPILPVIVEDFLSHNLDKVDLKKHVVVSFKPSVSVGQILADEQESNNNNVEVNLEVELELLLKERLTKR